MKAKYKSAILALCLILGACGNKGDLYIEPAELSLKQQALLDEFDNTSDDQKAKKKKGESSNSPESDQ